MKFNDVRLDGATERLVAAARATQATEGLPRESGRSLVALARGVRLYLEARQGDLALAQLDGIEKLMATCEDAVLKKAYVTLVKDVRTAVGRAA